MIVGLFFSIAFLWTNVKVCEASRNPNILIIIADDLGIGDVGSYGNYSIRTPNIDRLATEGIKLTHHLTAAALCTPSRAALLVSRYPARFGFTGEKTGPPVLLYVATRSHLPFSEVTLAEALSAANYSTGLVGKWHLGSHCQLFGLRCPGPLYHGFSFFYGILFTLTYQMAGGDDPFFEISLPNGIMAAIVVFGITIIFCLKRKISIPIVILLIISIPTIFCIWFACVHLNLHMGKPNVSNWFQQNLNQVIIRNGIPEKQTVNFDNLCQQLINESIEFIGRKSNEENPFFLVHSFLHVHTPMFSEKKNEGRSCCGRYGDNVEELDDGVGSLVQSLKDNNIEESTIIYFMSDHGGHLEVIDPKDGQRIGGYNKKFKGGKGMGGQEGGIRIPGIIKWHKRLPANKTIDIPTSTMDMMPTLLELAGLPTVHELVPNENTLDGISMADVLLGHHIPLKEERVFLHHCERHIHSVRLSTGIKVFKMHLAWPNWTANSTQCGWGNLLCICEESVDLWSHPLLFELNSDPYEEFPISATSTEYTNIVGFLKNYVEEWKKNTTYQEPIFSKLENTLWIPWRQPFVFWNW